MGTHPIFESDFDCLTDLRKAKMKRISDLKVPELHDELTKRGLPKKGKKQELVTRLSEHIRKQGKDPNEIDFDSTNSVDQSEDAIIDQSEMSDKTDQSEQPVSIDQSEDATQNEKCSIESETIDQSETGDLITSEEKQTTMTSSIESTNENEEKELSEVKGQEEEEKKNPGSTEVNDEVIGSTEVNLEEEENDKNQNQENSINQGQIDDDLDYGDDVTNNDAINDVITPADQNKQEDHISKHSDHISYIITSNKELRIEEIKNSILKIFPKYSGHVTPAEVDCGSRDSGFAFGYAFQIEAENESELLKEKNEIIKIGSEYETEVYLKRSNEVKQRKRSRSNEVKDKIDKKRARKEEDTSDRHPTDTDRHRETSQTDRSSRESESAARETRRK